MTKKIISVVGARPNFMKLAPLHLAFKENGNCIVHKICHTGQHFDDKMSDIFFRELDLPKPDFYLGIQSGTQTQQTAQIMVEFEKILLSEKPDLVIVVGDVTSTIACALTSSKLHIKVAHIEAGLRSFDNSMPEEINRKVTDCLSEYLFVTEQAGVVNLLNEGVNKEKIFLVGNIMVDCLKSYLPAISKSAILKKLEVQPNEYILATFHRPANVDNVIRLSEIVEYLNKISKKKTVIFPTHPRTKTKLLESGLINTVDSNILCIEPLGYFDFIALMQHATFIVTDSGGAQVEATVLNIPCLTVRNNTELPVTIEVGTNQLTGSNFQDVLIKSLEIINGNKKNGTIPELWDGQSAKRIVSIIKNVL